MIITIKIGKRASSPFKVYENQTYSVLACSLKNDSR